MKPSELSYEGMRLRVGVLDAIRTPLPYTDTTACQCSATKIPGVPQGAEEDGRKGETCRDYRGAEGCPQAGQAQSEAHAGGREEGQDGGDGDSGAEGDAGP